MPAVIISIMQPAVARLKPEKGLFDQSSPPGDAGSLKGQTRPPETRAVWDNVTVLGGPSQTARKLFQRVDRRQRRLTAKTDAEPDKLHQLLLCQ